MTDTDTDTIEPAAPPRGPVEHRAAEMVGVNESQRIIEVLAMPYDREVVHGDHRGVWRERCVHGAFTGVEKRSNRVKVNRDHNPERHVGRAVALHPSRDDGLVAELRISRTPLGDETLTLCEDRDLEPSVSFVVMPGGEQWLEHRSKRVLTRVYLAAISLVPEGAYGQVGAQVLSMRSALQPGEVAAGLESATPNLDRFNRDQYLRAHGITPPD